jgi:hypothetical protein
MAIVNIQSSYLITLRAGVNILVLFTFIPTITRFFRRKGTDPSQIDKYLTVASGVLLALGSLLIFLAAAPVSLILGQILIALGFSFTVTARSMLTNLASRRHMGLVSTSVTIASYSAIAVGGPLLAWTFKVGLSFGEVWVGLPFLLDSALFALGTLSVLCARTGHK